MSVLRLLNKQAQSYKNCCFRAILKEMVDEFETEQTTADGMDGERPWEKWTDSEDKSQ